MRTTRPQTERAAASASLSHAPSDATKDAAGSASAPQAEGVLVVSRDIVAACPDLQSVRRSARAMDPEAVWLVVLDSLAVCMTEGPLKLRRVSVAGAEVGCDLVKQVLSSRGVPMERVAFIDGSARAADEARVEITLVPGPPQTI